MCLCYLSKEYKSLLYYTSFILPKVDKSILELYILVLRIRDKRQKIQRQNITSKPVSSLCMSRMANQNPVSIKESEIDNSPDISQLEDIPNSTIQELNNVGYRTILDINNTDPRFMTKDTDIAWEAIKKIKKRAHRSHELEFALTSSEFETLTNEEMLSRMPVALLCMSMFEIYLREVLASEIESVSSSNHNSKKSVVDNMYKYEKRADAYSKYISELLDCSEDYVKDVIRGRIEQGLTKSERKEILDRDNNKCQNCCERENLEVHHIIPVSDGGTNDDQNLCTLCSDCHKKIAHRDGTDTTPYTTRRDFWDIIGD